MYKHYFDSSIGNDVDVEVVIEYQPAEKPIFAPNDAAHPGAPSEAEVSAVLVPIGEGGVFRDVVHDLSEQCLVRLAEEGLQKVERGEI